MRQRKDTIKEFSGIPRGPFTGFRTKRLSRESSKSAAELSASDNAVPHRTGLLMTKKEHEEILRRELEKQRTRYENVLYTVTMGVAAIIESRDKSTGRHVIRTGKTVELFMKKLMQDPDYHFTEAWAKSVIYAAPLHDLGKISVPDSVLLKSGPFTDEDFDHMKQHSVEGARVNFEVFSELNDLELVRVMTNIAHYHHEKWNGEGYPKGLKETEIPLEARIMALADVFDALVTKRCYKESMDYDHAFNIIEQSLGTHFDPQLGRKFLNMRQELTELYDRLLDEKTLSDMPEV